MAPVRAISCLLAGAAVLLTSCSTPPPPRVVSRPVYRLNTALLLTSDDGQLNADQLQARREEVVHYLTERGLLSPEDVLVSNAAAADRIIRVSVAASGGFAVTVFNPGNVGAYYSAPVQDSATYPAVSIAPSYDPFFDYGYYYNPWPEFGYYPYRQRDYLRPYYPRDYLRPVDPRHAPPPPVIVAPVPPPNRSNRPHDRDHDRDHRPGDPVLPRRPDVRDRNHDGVPDTRDHGAPSHPHYPPPSSPPRPETQSPLPPPPARPAPAPTPAPERNRDKDDPRNHTTDRER